MHSRLDSTIAEARVGAQVVLWVLGDRNTHLAIDLLREVEYRKLTVEFVG